jgi:hypothetical protein
VKFAEGRTIEFIFRIIGTLYYWAVHKWLNEARFKYLRYM